ncbi:MAG: HigA family addiction module antitoxin [Alphaproteobacteria bacterium]|jgi:addiction module HigA family antidote
MMAEKVELNVHPGLFLHDYFLKSEKAPAVRLAKALKVSEKDAQDLLHGERDIDAGLALKLGEAFHTTAEFWMFRQVRWALAAARAGKKNTSGTEKIIRLTA